MCPPYESPRAVLTITARCQQAFLLPGAVLNRDFSRRSDAAARCCSNCRLYFCCDAGRGLAPAALIKE